MKDREFLWGAATSAYQVEGAWNEDGKGLSVQDVKKIPAGTSNFQVAMDHYHHFIEDVQLFKELGLKAYRFSIAWTRIFPEGDGQVNQEGLDFYGELIDELLAADIEPIVTVYHFDLPQKLAEKGGWHNRETITAFENYCQTLFEAFGERVKYWLTINEQNMMVLASSAVLSGKKSEKQNYQENHHMLVAQAKVMKAYHDGNYPGMIGPAPNITYVNPFSCKPEDVLAAQNFSALRNWLFLDVPALGYYNHQAVAIMKKLGVFPEIEPEDLVAFREGQADFIALNYYSTNTVAEYKGREETPDQDQQTGFQLPGYFQAEKNPHLKDTEFGWEIDPVGFRITLHEVYSRYHLPLMITENGIGGRDELVDGEVHDEYRIAYLEDHISEMEKAMDEGVDVIGYCPWSALDVISTHEGIEKRYGFVYVNRTDTELLDLKRYKKESFYWYQKVIKNGGTING